MNELSQSLHCSVSNPESIDQCLERAIVTVMAEIDIEHVVRDGRGLGRRCVTENEFGFRINESPDEPSRSDSIDFGSCPGKPDLAPVIRDLQQVAGCGFLGRRFKRVGFLNQPFEVFPARTLKVIDSLNLLKTPFELLEMVRKRIRIRLASFLILDK